MLLQNGTHTIAAIYYYADAEPLWVMADLGMGYEDYHAYHGVGGYLPETKPGA